MRNSSKEHSSLEALENPFDDFGGVWGFVDGAPDDDEIDFFVVRDVDRRHPFLVSGIFAERADTRGEGDEVLGSERLDRGALIGAAHDTVKPRFMGVTGKPVGFCRDPFSVDVSELVFVEGGECGDGKNERTFLVGLEPFHHLTHRFAPRGGVDVEHIDAQRHDRFGGIGHRVGDIVEFKVEEDFKLGVDRFDRVDEGFSVADVGTQPHLEPYGIGFDLFDEGEVFFHAGEIEGDAQLHT